MQINALLTNPIGPKKKKPIPFNNNIIFILPIHLTKNVINIILS